MKFLRILFFSLLLSGFSLSVFAEAVNINTADAQTLAAVMKGVGPRTAKAIINYRSKNGPFKSLDELVNVKGIGPKTLAKNRSNLTLGKSSK